MDMKFEQSGFKELDNLLQKLPKNVENRVMQKAATKSMRVALPIVKQAAPRHSGKDRSPASKEYKTLKQNLKVKRFGRTRRGQKAARISTNDAFWGAIAEFGSRHQAAKPWFVPAMEKAQDAVMKSVSVVLGKGIADEAKKLGRGAK